MRGRSAFDHVRKDGFHPLFGWGGGWEGTALGSCTAAEAPSMRAGPPCGHRCLIQIRAGSAGGASDGARC